jgi:IrrE N-terminal-like domain
MSLRRGFKAEANRISLRLRQSLGLRPEAPIDLIALAQSLGLTVVPLSSFQDECPEAVRQLIRVDRSAFSAATIRCGPMRRVIVYNDSHDYGRQRNSTAHEISHVLLEHKFTLPIDTSGCRTIDRDAEDEAAWLGAVILISDAAAMHIVRTDMDTNAACQVYSVSAPLLQMRINASGARIRMARRYH